MVWIAIVFLTVFGVLEAAIWWATAMGLLYPLMETTAKAAAVLVAWAGIPVSRDGIQLFLSTRTLEIDVDCTAIQLMALYIALVIAYPMSLRMRSIGLAAGLPAIALVNLLRLLGVALASEHLSQPAFAFAHDFVFKVVMVLGIVALWGSLLLAARRDALQT